MAYISVSLSVNDPQPGNYQITITDCNGGSSVTVATGLTNPNDFPYTFNTDDFIDYGDCFNYTILDTLSGCESTGTFRDGGTVTPLPTQPTPTPVPDEDEVTIKVDISSGSTKLKFTATSTKTATQNTDIVFDYVLYKLDGSTKTVPVSMTILPGQKEIVKEVVLKDDFATIDARQHLIKNETTTDSSLTIKKYDQKIIEGETVKLLNYDFVACCNDKDIITVQVDPVAIQSGWVAKGGVINYNRKCYRPLRTSTNSKSVGVFYGPDYASCRISPCSPCIDVTPTPTPSKEVPKLGKLYTLINVADGDVSESINIKNSDLDKKVFLYNGRCLEIVDKTEFIPTVGLNDVRKPVVSSKDTYYGVEACKVTNKLPLDALVTLNQPVSFEKINLNRKNYFKPLEVKSGSSQAIINVNAFAPCGETIKNPDIFVFYDDTNSYDTTDLLEASASVRKWYTSLLEDGLGVQSCVAGAIGSNILDFDTIQVGDTLNLEFDSGLDYQSGQTAYIGDQDNTNFLTATIDSYDDSGNTAVTVVSLGENNVGGTLTSYCLSTQPIQGRFSGRLFEAPFKSTENPLALATYPILGSLSAGTLSDGSNIQYIDTPRISGPTNGLEFPIDMMSGQPYGTLGYSSNFSDTYIDSDGVEHPFSGHAHPSIYDIINDNDGEFNQNGWLQVRATDGLIPENFINEMNDGEIMRDSIVIIISNEYSEGHGNSSSSPVIIPNIQDTDTWQNSISNYLKVFKDQRNAGYSLSTFVFTHPKHKASAPVSLATTSAYASSMLGLCEGKNFDSTLQEKYSSVAQVWNGTSYDSVPCDWPEINHHLNTTTLNGSYYNDFSYLNTNGYSMFHSIVTGSEGWLELDTQYQANGHGLINFGFQVDPNIWSFNEVVVKDRLTQFVNSALLDALSTFTLIECGEDTFYCFDPGQTVLIGGNDTCLEVVGNYLVGDNFYGTGAFTIDTDNYANSIVLTGYNSSDFVTFNDCVSCDCGEGLDSNFRSSVELNNSGLVDVSVDVVGTYVDLSGDPINITQTVTVTADSVIIVQGSDFSEPSCVNISETLINLSGEPSVSIGNLGGCCDINDPVLPSPTATQTQTPTQTPSDTPTQTPTQTQTQTPSTSHSPTPPPSQSQTMTPTQTQTQTQTPTQTPTQTASNTPTPTPDPTGTAKATPTPTQTPTPTKFDCNELTLAITQPLVPSGEGCELDDIVINTYVLGNELGAIAGSNQEMSLLGVSANTDSGYVEISPTDYTFVINVSTVDPSVTHISITLPWQTYQNLDYNSFYVCITSLTGCELCDEITLQICECPKYHVFCDCRNGLVYSDVIKPYDGETMLYPSVNGENLYNVPLTVDSICDLLPLANVTQGSDGSNIYTITTDALQSAFLAHSYWNSDPNTTNTSSTWFDINEDGVVDNSDWNLILNDFLSADVLILNDYTECFDSDLNCLYHNYDGNEYIVGNYYMVTQLGGYSSCFRYDGVFYDCEDTVEHFATLQSVGANYVECEDCVNTHFPTPTPTQTPTQTPTPTSLNCQISISDLGDKIIGGQPFRVNAVSHYLQKRRSQGNLFQMYSEQNGANHEIIPAHNEINGEWTVDPTPEVFPSICTFFKSADLWQTTFVNNDGVALNQTSWEGIMVNNITQPIYKSCDTSCSDTIYLTNSTSQPISWGDFRNNYLELTTSLGGSYVAILPLVIYDETADTVYRISTTGLTEAIKTNTLSSFNTNYSGLTETISDDELLIVEELSNCESNHDIFVTDDINGGWSLNGVDGNPKISLKKGITYRFHIASDKDFWIGFSEDESTVLYDINASNPCVDAQWVETVNPNSLLEICYNVEDVNYCSQTKSTGLLIDYYNDPSQCGEIVHEKVYHHTLPYRYNKTLFFRPSCDFDCSTQLYYYDRISANDNDVNTPLSECMSTVGYILIDNNDDDCVYNTVITHPGYISENSGLIYDMIVTYTTCEGETHTITIVHPGPETNDWNGGLIVNPFDYIIEECIVSDSISIRYNHTVPIGLDNAKSTNSKTRAKCWCGSFIDVNKGQNCWEACGIRKPNFNSFDKKSGFITEKDGFKSYRDGELVDILIDIDLGGIGNGGGSVLGNVSRFGSCCGNCDTNGITIGVNYRYWLAQGCCDPTDVRIVRVFTEPQLGDGFNLIDKNATPDPINGELPMTCYKFTHEVLVGCVLRNIPTIPVVDFINDPCRTAVPDYDYALANNLCLECPQEPEPLPCNLPYVHNVQPDDSPDGQPHTIVGLPNTFSQFVLDFGEGTGEIELTFNSMNSSNRIQVYRVIDNNPSPYMTDNGVNNYGGLIKKADSLWIGDNLNGYYTGASNDEFNTATQEISELTQGGSVLNPTVRFYHGDCSNTWDIENNSPLYNASQLWDNRYNSTVVYQNATSNNSVPVEDIAIGSNGVLVTRGEGIDGQMNVVNTYPSSDSVSSDGNIRFRFNKGYTNRIYLVKVWDTTDTTGNNDGWTLDVSCIEPCSTEVVHNWVDNNPCDYGTLTCVGYDLSGGQGFVINSSLNIMDWECAQPVTSQNYSGFLRQSVIWADFAMTNKIQTTTALWGDDTSDGFVYGVKVPAAYGTATYYRGFEFNSTYVSNINQLYVSQPESFDTSDGSFKQTGWAEQWYRIRINQIAFLKTVSIGLDFQQALYFTPITESTDINYTVCEAYAGGNYEITASSSSSTELVGVEITTIDYWYTTVAEYNANSYGMELLFDGNTHASMVVPAGYAQCDFIVKVPQNVKVQIKLSTLGNFSTGPGAFVRLDYLRIIIDRLDVTEENLPATFSYVECPTQITKTITVQPNETTSICSILGGVTLVDGPGSIQLNSSNNACEITSIPLSQYFSVYSEDTSDGQYAYGETATGGRFVYNQVNYDPLNMFTEASLAASNYNSYFTVQETGIFNFKATQAIHLSNQAYNNVAIKPILRDIVTNEIVAYGPLRLITHTVDQMYQWNFYNVVLSVGQKIRHEFVKVSHSSADNGQSLYIYTAGSEFKLHDFDLITSPTTLFINSDTPNIPSNNGCDYAYLDPCCTVPAEGYMIVNLPNGYVQEYIINSEGQILDCPCCDYEISVNNPCLTGDHSNFYVANSFTPNNDGLNELWGPIFTNPECVSWSVQIFNRWGAYYEHNGPSLWDGTGTSGNLFSTGVYNWVLTWQALNGQSGTAEGSVTILS